MIKLNQRPIFVLPAVALALMLVAPAHADDHKSKTAHDLLGSATNSWQNQGGSTMSFTLTQSTQPGVYTVTGNYINNEAGFGCQGTSYPLSGVFYDGTATISFSVAWSNAYANCASVTGWTGYYSPNDQTIYTDWNLSYLNSSGQMVIQSGSDQFTPVSTAKHPSPFAKPAN